MAKKEGADAGGKPVPQPGPPVSEGGGSGNPTLDHVVGQSVPSVGSSLQKLTERIKKALR